MPLREVLLVFDLDRQELVGDVREFNDPAEAAQASPRSVHFPGRAGAFSGEISGETRVRDSERGIG